MASNPKFKVGQVVYAERVNRYYDVTHIALQAVENEPFFYYLGDVTGETFVEYELRALTPRERGEPL